VGDAVARLVARGITVVVAAGNDGARSLTPPATSVDALTVGGLDDRNVLDAGARALWHANFGTAAPGWDKPELVAPSVWVVAPVLPGTDVAGEARRLFAGRAAGDSGVEARIAELRLVTPHYQHVEGTSFASPIVAGTLACMLEALGGRLAPRRARELLLAACHPVHGASRERQGAGALDAGRAVALALAERAHGVPEFDVSPALAVDGVRFQLHDHRARTVHVVGSWDGWRRPGAAARELEPGTWEAHVAPLAPGDHAYKLVLDLGVDGTTWLPDPRNPRRAADGFGGWNSLLAVPTAP
jgi:serine protease AprX